MFKEKRLLALLSASLLALSPVAGWAGSQGGKIVGMYVRASDGMHFFALEGVPQNRPACAAQTVTFAIKNENSTVGKTQISMLLAAHAAGRPIRVFGANTCTRWGDIEDLDLLEFF